MTFSPYVDMVQGEVFGFRKPFAKSPVAKNMVNKRRGDDIYFYGP
jgi:hypothetical protein